MVPLFNAGSLHDPSPVEKPIIPDDIRGGYRQINRIHHPFQ